MRVCGTQVFRGPHVFSNLPMIRIDLDLGTLEQFPTDRLPGFVDALMAHLPGLEKHGCSYGVAGGFVSRMRQGTWLGHVAEHIAIELQTLVGNRVTRGKTRSVGGQPGRYYVMFTYVDEAIGLAAGRLAIELVESLLPEHLKGLVGAGLVSPGNHPGSFGAGLESLKALAAERALGPTTRSLVHEADRRGIPWVRLDEASLILLGQGRHQKRIRASCSDLTSAIATGIAADKSLTKVLLSQAGLPVPKGAVVRSALEACAAAERIGYSVVTKPLDGNHGRGVSSDLSSREQVVWGFEQAAEHSRSVIVEQYFTGADHRILVIGGDVVAVAERVPAQVTGNGASSVGELISAANLDPRRGKGHCSAMTWIEIDAVLVNTLQRVGLSLTSVPFPGQAVRLRPTANLSTGGVAIDRTEDIHPENALMAQRAARIVGLDIAGIDFICPDIGRSVLETGGGIIEVNAGPGFRMHLEPFQGRPRNVARPVLEMLFPKGTDGRIPIFAITGTNGKSTTARMLGHILQTSGLNVGLTSTTGVYLNDRRIVSGDCSGPRSARLVLKEPHMDAAVLECARGGILREGLAFDKCDIGAVLNVAEDHLGLGGVNTLKDLAAVKSVVTEAVRRGGWSILNADNAPTFEMATHARGHICYFSLKGPGQWPAFLSEHVEKGGRAVCREFASGTGDLVIYEDNEAICLMKISDIPATFRGWAEFNVANALAAVAMAHCHGVPLATIRAAMETFTTSFEQSPGRMNVFDGNGFRTILDYCHNPDGLREIGKLLDKMRPDYQRTMGLFGSPGDRRDADILEMGALVARTFDVMVFREDNELRGRAPGTIAALLRQGALSTGCSPDRIHTALCETEAIDLFLGMAREGDLLLMTADDIWAAWKTITEFEPDTGRALIGAGGKLQLVAN
ncbi:MAG: cyanophycin synthetase [Hyphomonas sp.]